MEISELRDGDRVLVEAVVLKAVDDAEGGAPLVLVAIPQDVTPPSRAIAQVRLSQIHGKLEREAAPEIPPWPLGTLDRSHESQRAAMNEPAQPQ